MDAENGIDEVLPARLNTDKCLGTALHRIIIAEDDEEMAALLARAFEKAGYDTTVCYDGWSLLDVLGIFPHRHDRPDVALVVSDIRLPGMTGLDVLKTCAYVGMRLPVILITAFGDAWTHEKARELGAVDVLDKPFDIDDLIGRVRKLVPPM